MNDNRFNIFISSMVKDHLKAKSNKTNISIERAIIMTMLNEQIYTDSITGNIMNYLFITCGCRDTETAKRFLFTNPQIIDYYVDYYVNCYKNMQSVQNKAR